MMPARRRHEKSHHGCLPCKKRHVKCDEERPVCRACKKYGALCEYASSVHLSWSQKESHQGHSNHQDTCGPPLSRSTQTPPTPTSSSASSAIVIRDFSPTEVLNLELMHHYATSTWLTLSDDFNALHLKQVLIPQQAMSHSFTLHGILALGALHLAYIKTDQRSRYLPSALSHYDLAVSSYRQSIQNITEDNCTMLFAFSSILVQFAFGLPQIQPPVSSQEVDVIASIIEIYHYCRGITTVVQAGREWIRKGILGYLLTRKYVDAKEENEPLEFKDAFEKIQKLLNQDESLTMEKRESYQETMQRLLQCAATIVEYPSDKAIPMIVPSTVRATFVSCLEAREPAALALEAYHAVLLLELDEFWWGKGWAHRVIAGIAKELNDDWKETIIWPMDKVGIETKYNSCFGMIAQAQGLTADTEP